MAFFEINKELSLNVLNEDFGYKSDYHIQSLFAWFTSIFIYL